VSFFSTPIRLAVFVFTSSLRADDFHEVSYDPLASKTTKDDPEAIIEAIRGMTGVRRACAVPKPTMDQRVQKAIRLMQENLSRKLIPGEIAAAVNLSLAHLRYLFKTETGQSPAQYLRSLRMQEAERLLKTTFLSVKEVMHRIGVRDESHFTRDFKKIYGMTPAQYGTRHRRVELKNDSG
jgi:transcriptional regulator GlxA family with amidase domain